MDPNAVDGLPALDELAGNAADTTVDNLRTVTKRERILANANDEGPDYTATLQRKAQTMVRVAQNTDPQQAPPQQAQLQNIEQIVQPIPGALQTINATLQTTNATLQALQTDMRALTAKVDNQERRTSNKEANTDAELELMLTLPNGQENWQIPQAVQAQGPITADTVSGHWTLAKCNTYITAYGPNIGGDLHHKRLWVLRHLGRRRI